MKQLVLTILILLICASIDFAQTSVPDVDDNQLWTETSVSLPLRKDLNFIFTPSLRFGRDIKHLIDERATVALSYRANKNLAFAAAYLYRAAQPDARRRSFQNRPFGSFTLTLPLGKFALADRNQFEYQRNNSRPDTFVYRNRVALERSLELFGSASRALIAFETFYDKRPNRFFRQRLTVDVSKKFSKKITGEVFYTRQFDKLSRPGNLNIVGITLRFQL